MINVVRSNLFHFEVETSKYGKNGVNYQKMLSRMLQISSAMSAIVGPEGPFLSLLVFAKVHNFDCTGWRILANSVLQRCALICSHVMQILHEKRLDFYTQQTNDFC